MYQPPNNDNERELARWMDGLGLGETAPSPMVGDDVPGPARSGSK